MLRTFALAQRNSLVTWLWPQIWMSSSPVKGTLLTVMWIRLTLLSEESSVGVQLDTGVGGWFLNIPALSATEGITGTGYPTWTL